MNKIELYDIITLDDDKDYSVTRIIDLENETYYLLTEVDNEENPNFDNMKIVKDNKDNTLQPIENKEKLEELKELFISSLEAKI